MERYHAYIPNGVNYCWFVIVKGIIFMILFCWERMAVILLIQLQRVGIMFLETVFSYTHFCLSILFSGGPYDEISILLLSAS